MSGEPETWVLTDGKAGMESQCLGLAEALGVAPAIKRIAPRFPWSLLPPRFWLSPLSAPGPEGDALAPPWPDLLIATGRQTVAPAAAIKRLRGDRVVAVQIQNPRIDPANFDVVIAPAHDRLAGANVVSTLGALHRVTPERLADAARAVASRYALLPRPLVAVLVGGGNSQFRMTGATADRLAALLARAAREQGVGLAVTPSRRTGAENVARMNEQLAGLPAEIWDGAGGNPYFAMLALADAFVVTGDSVNMVSEACATGKPVHVFQLDGGSAKFDRFHDALAARGITRPFSGAIESWRYAPPDDIARAVAAVRRCLDRLPGQSDARAAAPAQSD